MLISAAFPGVFADLLYKDFHTDQKFTLTTYTNNGVVSITDFRMLFTGSFLVDILARLLSIVCVYVVVWNGLSRRISVAV